MAEEGVRFQMYADPGLLPRAARFTTGYVRLDRSLLQVSAFR